MFIFIILLYSLIICSVKEKSFIWTVIVIIKKKNLCLFYNFYKEVIYWIDVNALFMCYLVFFKEWFWYSLPEQELQEVWKLPILIFWNKKVQEYVIITQTWFFEDKYQQSRVDWETRLYVINIYLFMVLLFYYNRIFINIYYRGSYIP